MGFTPSKCHVISQDMRNSNAPSMTQEGTVDVDQKLHHPWLQSLCHLWRHSEFQTTVEMVLVHGLLQQKIFDLSVFSATDVSESRQVLIGWCHRIRNKVIQNRGGADCWFHPVFSQCPSNKVLFFVPNLQVDRLQRGEGTWLFKPVSGAMSTWPLLHLTWLWWLTEFSGTRSVDFCPYCLTECLGV